MDLQRMSRGPSLSPGGSLIDLPEYIITSFLPGARPLLDRYPRLFRFLGVLLALWYFGPISRLQSLWSRFSSILVASVSVANDEDLFQYLTAYIAERKTLRADQSLNATLNQPGEPKRRHRMDPEYEESSRSANQDPTVRYEQSPGLQLFVYKKRLFYITRKLGDGHGFINSRYKRAEILTLSCLGRSTGPVKELIEHVYYLNKDKERTSTIIRRPYNGGFGNRLSWSRLTAKPRRALHTVILDAGQKEQVIGDMEEYMAKSTMTFYADHGIPYRRGYLFHGPPGVGKTSFALALAAKFNLDVYNMTLLDQDLTDGDLVALLNQLPGRSLLLLEDVDSAGLGRKGKPRRFTRSRRGKGSDGSSGRIKKSNSTEDTEPDSDEDDLPVTASRVTLSGLLNAIDGVAAPEGHILIMTTNKPYELDDALVRAGRISCRVGFTNATKTQASEIFLNMYVEPSTKSTARLGDEENFDRTTDPDIQDIDGIADRHSHASPQLLEQAKKFGDAIPEFDFSPADLQDYLLIHKKDSQKALDGLQAWIEKSYEERRLKEENDKAQQMARRDAEDEELRQLEAEVKASLAKDAKGTPLSGRGARKGKSDSEATEQAKDDGKSGIGNTPQEDDKGMNTPK